ncbi:peptidoglycan DD-metalloendopeptidase family protein [Parabacteroides sp. PF5-6]|uniref:peptidoglycan DD-metalloendopeptidase family protein n=1 Tax=Parabacteroides sp. PF5-6 TaxID=1742403 RepID=UPI002407714B|nr:peptidoglycan DD-metalloendopeptidase family protein [Parabacteroides sp. PF5-6]MDF9829877.1 murein DD-endopeptidase MepM/ murein hydrolase activator NlpD [Parabacteroides sp. PF5-6]
MNIRVLLSLAGIILSTTVLYAQTPVEEGNTILQSQSQLMEERVSELMADRVPAKRDIALKELIESNERVQLLLTESLNFPADELYGSHWENKWVDPFRGEVKAIFPDSFAIDCSSFVLPIDSEIKVTSKYGPRRRRMHRGIDLKVYTGDTIRAAFDGKIRIRSFERRGYGNYVVIRHPNGLETIYGHLSKFLVNENDIIRAGQPIGLGGNTGRSTGSHLHFETRFLGQAINPAEIIDFTNGTPHQDLYVFRNVKINGRKSNIYTSSDDRMAYHRVKSGDTLGKIARIYGTSINEICRLNGIKSTTTLRIGQSLRVNTSAEKAAKAPAPQKTTVKATQAAVASAQNTNTSGAGESKEPVYHKIQSGDTLGAIAMKYGTTIEKLCQLNGISRTTILRLGRNIRCS